jgi:hypothetical protein
MGQGIYQIIFIFKCSEESWNMIKISDKKMSNNVILFSKFLFTILLYFKV